MADGDGAQAAAHGAFVLLGAGRQAFADLGAGDLVVLGKERSSFRFVGKCGRFTACRVYDKGPTRSWQAHRVIHQRHYKPHLGVTEHLTIDSLEQAAARLQSYVDSR